MNSSSAQLNKATTYCSVLIARKATQHIRSSQQMAPSSLSSKTVQKRPRNWNSKTARHNGSFPKVSARHNYRKRALATCRVDVEEGDCYWICIYLADSIEIKRNCDAHGRRHGSTPTPSPPHDEPKQLRCCSNTPRYFRPNTKKHPSADYAHCFSPSTPKNKRISRFPHPNIAASPCDLLSPYCADGVWTGIDFHKDSTPHPGTCDNPWFCT